MSAATAPAWEADLRLAAGDVLTSNQRLHYYARSSRGIIPARAGFTAVWTGTGPGRPDHPRSRGVYARTHTSTGG